LLRNKLIDASIPRQLRDSNKLMKALDNYEEGEEDRLFISRREAGSSSDNYLRRQERNKITN
jgi:hypothetical protein